MTSAHDEMNSLRIGRVARGGLARVISKSRQLGGLGLSSIGGAFMLVSTAKSGCATILQGRRYTRKSTGKIAYATTALRRGRRNRPGLDLAQNLPQHRSQLLAAHLALAELHAHVKRIVLRAIIKQKRLRTRRRSSLFLTRATRFVARQTALRNTMHHLRHLFFSRLPRHLQQKRLRQNPA